MKKIALIVAGGAGARMGSDVPKQFLLLKGKPMLMHTMEKFRGIADEIVVVLPKEQMERWQQLCITHNCNLQHRTVAGGNTRTASVRCGLEALGGDGLLAIHDAVRPLVTPLLIDRLFNSAATHGSAVPLIPVRETLRKMVNDDTLAVKRDEFRVVQTPQVFHLEQIRKAYALTHNESYTDDASVFEHNGGKIHFVDGETTNLKITFPEDLPIAEALME